MIEKFEIDKKYKVGDFANLVGTLITAGPGVNYSKVYWKRFEREKWLTLLLNNNDYDGYIKIKKYTLEDLEKWNRNIQIEINPIRLGKFSLIISLDASRTGWGAESKGEIISVFWNQEDKKPHNNYLELLAAFSPWNASLPMNVNAKSCYA